MKSVMKIAGSGSISQSHGSEDPESTPKCHGSATLVYRARIFKRLWSPGIDSKEWILRAYVAWRAGTITLHIPPRFQAPIDSYVPDTHIMYLIRRCWFLKCSEEWLLVVGGRVLLVHSEIFFVPISSLGRYVFGSEISYNKAPPACLG